MSHGSLALLTCGEPHPGLVGSHFLGETQMQRIPAGHVTEVGHARSPTDVNEKCPDDSNDGRRADDAKSG